MLGLSLALGACGASESLASDAAVDTSAPEIDVRANDAGGEDVSRPDASADAGRDDVATDAGVADVGAGVRSALVGDWIESRDTMTLRGLHLGAGGDAATSYVGAGVCTGSITWTDLRWSATDTDVILTGAGVCRGLIVCAVGSTSSTYNCAFFTGQLPFSGCGARGYTLSSDERTLSLGRTCTTGSEVTLMRR